MHRFLFLSLFFCIHCIHAEVTAFYLSWYDDPTSTITIQWITPDLETDDTVHFSENEKWTSQTGSHHSLSSYNIHQITLTNLSPNTRYSFRIAEETKSFQFQTAPLSLDSPLRFVVGGDLYLVKKLFRKMNQRVAQLNPLFCALGGDLAYAFHRTPLRIHSTSLHRWISFLSEWQKQMISEDGRVIPFLITPGNHDLNSDHFELFFNLFAFPQKKLYRSIHFGNYLNLTFLDTDHLDPIEGKQTSWLKETLQKNRTTPYHFAIYHEAAYPSFYPYEGIIPEKIRTFWCPLFDEYQLTAAFEHHNHAFKRTYPLKNHKIDPKGIIYFGDGCWGALPRKTNDMWYLEKKARKNNVYLVELSKEKALIQAIDLSGKALDEVSLLPN